MDVAGGTAARARVEDELGNTVKTQFRQFLDTCVGVQLMLKLDCAALSLSHSIVAFLNIQSLPLDPVVAFFCIDEWP
jgi:hypothetical protein